MPHVVLEGPVDLGDFHAHFEPILRRENDGVRRTVDAWLDTRGRGLLISAIVVEHGRTQKFFIELSAKDKGLTVRLEPLTDPEKTAGVRKLLADVTTQLRERFPGTRLARTNVAEVLGDNDDR